MAGPDLRGPAAGWGGGVGEAGVEGGGEGGTGKREKEGAILWRSGLRRCGVAVYGLDVEMWPAVPCRKWC